MSEETLQQLLDDYVTGRISVEDKQRLLLLLNDPAVFREAETILLLDMQEGRYDADAAPDVRERLHKRLDKAMNAIAEKEETVRPVSFLRRWWAAAVLLLIAAGAYLWLQNGPPPAVTNAYKQSPADIEHGKDGAILTLADGTQVVLDSLGNGIIATQSGSQVWLKEGRLVYDPTGSISGEILYNTMRTPKGRQFNVLLPDGTRVWLNAGSSLRYPTAFLGKERRIEITGEVYVEVTKDKEKPFFVQVNNQAEIEVLGTSFNVNAYGDERSINTTLIEGSVKVVHITRGDQPADTKKRPGYIENAILKPGQQARIVTSWEEVPAGQKARPGMTGVNVIDNIDTKKATAWRRGVFNFDNASLEEVMRQLARWYDIEIVYQGTKPPDILFGGELSRDVSLAGLIKGLEGVGVHFRIEEGRRLIVLP